MRNLCRRAKFYKMVYSSAIEHYKTQSELHCVEENKQILNNSIVFFFSEMSLQWCS